MSKYDQLAFASNPNLYLASPVLTDQSNGPFSLTINNLALGGQPIIYEHTSSFKVEATATANIAANAMFKVGISTELVLLANLPTEEVPVLLADNGTGLILTPNSIILRLNYNLNESLQTLIAEVPISDWRRKLYITIMIGENQATLTVNDKTSLVSLNGVLDPNITEIAIGSTFPTDYYFLLDGLGVYSRKLYSKQDAIDDGSLSHNVYAASVFSGVSTNFSTYTKGQVLDLTLADFTFYADIQEESFIYNYPIPANDTDISYVVLSTNDDTLAIDWDLNGGEVGSFTRFTTIPISATGSVVSVRINSRPTADFKLRIENVLSADVISESPAFLIATGRPIFPAVWEDSIVDCPEGVIMNFASYAGTWLTSDTEELQEPPQSIELVFKPAENGVIFSSTDGEVTLTAQTGYTMWLNGVLVADLSDILMNQWNHLVLVKTAAAATSFTLNTAVDPTELNYLFLTAYAQELITADVEKLYKVAIGVDTISVTETPATFTEGVFENGQAFQTFGNNWAIVGAGGN
jgi:hypothetical protein